MNKKIFVCGDTHGLVEDTRKLNMKNFPEQKSCDKEDVVIQLGDFGWVWYPIGANKEQAYWLDWLVSRRYTLAVVLGNHENYNIIETLPTVKMWDNKVKVLKRKSGNIYFLTRGAIYIINGRKVLAIGGAKSMDSSSRIKDTSWWEQEILSSFEMKQTLEEIAWHNNRVDYVLTHTFPTHIISLLPDDVHDKMDDPVASFLENVSTKIEFKEWHCGHFHKDMILVNGKYQCHYRAKPLELK